MKFLVYSTNNSVYPNIKGWELLDDAYLELHWDMAALLGSPHKIYE